MLCLLSEVLRMVNRWSREVQSANHRGRAACESGPSDNHPPAEAGKRRLTRPDDHAGIAVWEERSREDHIVVTWQKPILNGAPYCDCFTNFRIAASVLVLKWCSMPSASISASPRGTPSARRKWRTS